MLSYNHSSPMHTSIPRLLTPKERKEEKGTDKAKKRKKKGEDIALHLQSAALVASCRGAPSVTGHYPLPKRPI